MKIASRWKLTFDPTGSPEVLLNFGEYLDDEMDWGLGRTVEVRPLAAADAPFIRPAGNNVYQFDFTVFKTATDDLAARVAMLEELMSTDDLGKKPLRLQLATESGTVTGYYYQWANAAVKTCNVRRDIDSSRPRWGKKYSVVATKFTKTIVP